ncbi:hydroxyisourate hydrolase [Arthrobacter sp. GCM10027362]|uniref:hydroxyisourate hydrolase n=1 Tax=Arthrobacter sp. GCM10027362 TaxID=3273379 RepID=UPI0036269F6C
MTASHVTTHVLDGATGRPAAGVSVALEDAAGVRLAGAATDDDGRVAGLGPERLAPGDYRLVFGTGAYFAARGQETFFPEVGIVFRISDGEAHYHVPLLLSPFAYSTYRGS